MLVSDLPVYFDFDSFDLKEVIDKQRYSFHTSRAGFKKSRQPFVITLCDGCDRRFPKSLLAMLAPDQRRRALELDYAATRDYLASLPYHAALFSMARRASTYFWT
jgi:hypothetical protein